MITELQHTERSQGIECLKPGIYHDVPEAIYHAIDAGSYSRLKHIVYRSEAHCKASIDNPRDPSPDQIIGSALDCRLLTPDDFDSRFVVSDLCRAEKKDGKKCFNPGKVRVGSEWLCGVHARADRHAELFKSLVASHRDNGFEVESISDANSTYMRHEDGRCVRIADHAPNAKGLARMLREGRVDVRVDIPPYGNDDPRVILTGEQMDRAEMMRDAVMNHSAASNVLSVKGFNQLSAIFIDEVTGLRCKLRTDRAIPSLGTIADLKKTDDASPNGWERSIFKWGYHLQAAMYPRGLAALGEVYDSFVHIAVEDSEPFGVGVYRLRDDVLDLAWKQLRDAMERYAAALHSGKWPCYSDRIEDIGLPGWAEKQIANSLLEESL